MKNKPNREKNNNKSKNLLSALLVETGFSGYKFDTSFTLRFERRKPKKYEDHTLPWIVEVRLLSDWSFNTERELLEKWMNTDVFPTHEPDEPIKAVELTCLRWMEGSIVKSLELTDKKMRITFENGKEISCSLFADMDLAWEITEPNTPEWKEIWSVTCEDGEIYIKTPL